MEEALGQVERVRVGEWEGEGLGVELPVPPPCLAAEAVGCSAE